MPKVQSCALLSQIQIPLSLTCPIICNVVIASVYRRHITIAGTGQDTMISYQQHWSECASMVAIGHVGNMYICNFFGCRISNVILSPSVGRQHPRKGVAGWHSCGEHLGVRKEQDVSILVREVASSELFCKLLYTHQHDFGILHHFQNMKHRQKILDDISSYTCR